MRRAMDLVRDLDKGAACEDIRMVLQAGSRKRVEEEKGLLERHWGKKYPKLTAYLEGLTEKSRHNSGTAMTRSVSVADFDYEYQANYAVSFLAYKGFKAQLKADDCGRTDPVLVVVTRSVALESGA